MPRKSTQKSSTITTEKPWVKALKFALMYPTLIMFMLGGAFKGWDIGKSVYYGVSIGSVGYHESQQEMWVRNRDCFQKSKFHEFKNEDGKLIRFLPCQATGDLYVEVYPTDPKKKPVTQWIEVGSLVNDDISLFLDSLSASDLKAASSETKHPEIVCQYLTETEKVVIIRYENMCIMHRVNIQTRKILSEETQCPVACK